MTRGSANRLRAAMTCVYRDGIALTLLGLALAFVQWGILANMVAPSGPDPGNFLAFAWQLTGDFTRLAPGVYPPAIPAVLRGLLGFTDPILALKLTATIAFVTGSIGFAFACRLLGFPWTITVGATALFASSGYNQEIIAFGGYPQMMGCGFLLVTVAAFERWLLQGDYKVLIAGSLTAAATLAAHHLLGGILPALGGIVLCLALIELPGKRQRIATRGLLFGTIALVCALPILPTYMEMFRLLGGPAVGNGERDLFWALLTPFGIMRNARAFWAVGFVIAIWSIVRNRSRLGTRTAFTLIAGSWLCCILLVEQRVIQPLPAGISMGLALITQQKHQSNQATAVCQSFLNRSSRFVHLVPMLLIIGLTLMTVRDYPVRHEQVNAFYGVMNRSHIAAMDWLRTHTPENSIVAASSSSQGHPLGWWVEGYAQRRCLYQVDPKWLIYGREKELATVANTLFELATDQERFLEILQEHQIEYLYLSKPAVFKDISQAKGGSPDKIQMSLLASQDSEKTASRRDNGKGLKSILSNLMYRKEITVVFENDDVIIYQVQRHHS
jgi:hypothetical protein